ncbi:hypothetical protein ACJRO7_002766 [Eucalyptus globulus]|uniref:Cytochrome P450 n=1 Tax=Eucalyptus globulus TaxID=34317 RepID=A0ABD3M118_EUCGL
MRQHMQSHGGLSSIIAVLILILFMVLVRLLIAWWILPLLAQRKLRKNGFGGPTPSFPLGNIMEMKKRSNVSEASLSKHLITHDIHSTVFPYFAEWQKLHGKVFIYWLGTKPFLYIADPEFLKKTSVIVKGKNWGKPDVFKLDRKPMFGNGLLMTEGDEWVQRRHIITPAFSPSNLKEMTNIMVESTKRMLTKWVDLTSSGHAEVDVECEITATAGDIIAQSSFGISPQECTKVLEKLRALQVALFKTNRHVGVPYNNFMYPKHTLEAKRLGNEIDDLLMAFIMERRKSAHTRDESRDLLGVLIQESHVEDNKRQREKLATRELVDECKTFFFGGHETTALALTWTLFLLALYPEWQKQLREEIEEVVGDKYFEVAMLAGLKKMGLVMNEVLRLYSPAPNVLRQAMGDIWVNDTIIPDGTNIWIDVVSMHHDPTLWGDDVNEFKPERFNGDSQGGCKHKMGFLPFGFGGRMCIGRNLMMMEYKIVLSLVLSRFSFSLSPYYCHSPSIMLSLRPACGLPLIVQPL